MIAFLAYEGASLIDISGPISAFKAGMYAARPLPPHYQTVVVSMKGGVVETEAGIPIVTVAADEIGPIDTLVIPGCLEVGVDFLTENAGLLNWIQRTSTSARRTCSVCTGAFLLAAAGLTKGKRVATHWAYVDALSRQFPETTVDGDAVFVKEGSLWSSAGVTSGIDLALALVEEDLGREIASQAARLLVVYLRRSAGQSQYSTLLATQARPESSRFDDLHLWMAENLHLDLTVADLAEQACMSPRNFARLYTKAIGRTPAKTLTRMRVEAAGRLLIECRDSVQQIARRTGFSDDEGLKKAFSRAFGISPKEYRNRFSSS